MAILHHPKKSTDFVPTVDIPQLTVKQRLAVIGRQKRAKRVVIAHVMGAVRRQRVNVAEAAAL